MRTHSGHSYRGVIPYADQNLGTGGNQVASNTTGNVPGTSNGTAWHPTVIYLLILLVIEWAAFLFINALI